MSLPQLPAEIIGHEIASFLTFIDSMNFRKTAKGISCAYTCIHDPRLDYQFAIKKAASEGNVEAVKFSLKSHL
jgi:hypothetical protein